MATCRNRESDSPSYTGTHRERTSQFRAMSAVGPRDGPERHVAGAPARLRLRVLRGLVHQRAEVVVHRQHRDDAPQQDVTVRVGLAFDASRFAGDDDSESEGPGLILALHWQRHVYTVTGVLHRDGRFPLNPL